MLGYEGHIAQAHVLTEHAQALGSPARVLDALEQHVHRHPEHRGQAAHHIAVVRHLRISQHGLSGAVHGQGHPVGVVDAPAGRRGLHRGVEVLLGGVGVLGVAEDLHGPQLRGQHGEDARRQGPYGREPGSEAVGGLLGSRGVLRGAHGHLPVPGGSGRGAPLEGRGAHADGVQLADPLGGSHGGSGAVRPHGEGGGDDHNGDNGREHGHDNGKEHGRPLSSAEPASPVDPRACRPSRGWRSGTAEGR